MRTLHFCSFKMQKTQFADSTTDLRSSNPRILHFCSFRLFFLVFFMIAVPSCFYADGLSRERVRMLERQSIAAGITSLDTYKRVFGAFEYLNRDISIKARVYPDYFGLSFETEKQNAFVISRSSPFKVLDYSADKKYLFTIPLVYDYAVIVSRKSEQIEVSDNIENAIENKICATYPSDILIGDWVSEFGITEFNREGILASSACQKIIDNEADIVFLPQRLAELIFDMMGFHDELYISRPLFEISYRLVFSEEREAEYETMNLKILEMIENGELQKLCKRYGANQSLKSPAGVQKRLLFYVIVFLFAFLVFNFIIFVKVIRKYKEIKSEQAD